MLLREGRWGKVARGVLIAAAGAALTYLTEWLSGQDFGAYTPMVVAAWSGVVQAIRKGLEEWRSRRRLTGE